FNIPIGINTVNTNNVAQLKAVKPDSFGHESAKTAQKHATVPFGYNVTSLYSPSQLLNAYTNPDYVSSLINSNENLQKILDANGLEGKIYPENISRVSKSHLISTTAIALQIADAMNISASDKQILAQAGMFHDFGKILIPSEILEKPSGLTTDEKKIMDLHAELGAELLSSTNMNERVLNIVKNHHKPQNENPDILGQILSVADVYSALREERSYKAPMSVKSALEILDQKAENSEVSTEVVSALKKSLSSSKYAA
ncbi:MAG: HD domain-containing protein, partial [Candidatus Gastranaerophilales bacterium]|nr:HD domain-containing protein [Candidatus Gastranaerophilales bacterium]